MEDTRESCTCSNPAYQDAAAIYNMKGKRNYSPLCSLSATIFRIVQCRSRSSLDLARNLHVTENILRLIESYQSTTYMYGNLTISHTVRNSWLVVPRLGLPQIFFVEIIGHGAKVDHKERIKTRRNGNVVSRISAQRVAS